MMLPALSVNTSDNVTVPSDCEMLNIATEPLAQVVPLPFREGKRRGSIPFTYRLYPAFQTIISERKKKKKEVKRFLVISNTAT